MRLSVKEVEIIKALFQKHFAPGDRLWLFGSRVDDSKRGGDIDLFVETSLNAHDAVCSKQSYIVELWSAIGEQKIDIVLKLNDHFELPIYEVAKTEGIRLI